MGKVKLIGYPGTFVIKRILICNVWKSIMAKGTKVNWIGINETALDIFKQVF